MDVVRAATAVVGDVARLRVDNATARDPVKVAVDVGAVDYDTCATVWLDTDPSRPGPEFRVSAYPDSDGIWLSRVTGLRDRGRVVACDRLRVAAGAGADRTFRFWIPRSCVGDPDRVRDRLGTRFPQVLPVGRAGLTAASFGDRRPMGDGRWAMGDGRWSVAARSVPP